MSDDQFMAFMNDVCDRKELDTDEVFRRVAKAGEILDEWWDDACYELVREEGKVVGEHYWDSGEPSLSYEPAIVIYQFRGLFVGDDDSGMFGPYETFAEAARVMGLLFKQPTTIRIWVAPEFEQK
jgi:hypothetical protein